MPTTFAERFAAWLIRWRWIGLAFAALLLAAGWHLSGQLEFDRSVENMFGADHPLLQPYRQLKRTFGDEEVVLMVYVDPQLMGEAGLRRVAALTSDAAKAPGVLSAASLTTTPLGMDILDRRKPAAAAYLQLMEGYTVGPDRRTAAIACMLDPNATSDERGVTLAALEAIADSNTFDTVLVGGPIMLAEAYELVESDGRYLGWVATGLLTLNMLACFRSLRWVLVPLLIVSTTLVWTRALVVVCGVRMTIVSSMMWSTLTVIGIATVMHLVVNFRSIRAQGLSPREALTSTAALLAVPIFWTCLTTAGGFASLHAAEVGPIRDFGTMMVVASLVLMLSLALIVPGVALAGRLDVDPHWAWGEEAMHRMLRWLLAEVRRWPKSIAAGCMLVVAAVAAGIARSDVETDFTRNFRDSSPIVTSYTLVENNLGGSGVWDVIVPAPSPEKLTEEYLDRLRELQRRLRTEVGAGDSELPEQERGLTKVISLADLLDTAPTRELLFPNALLRYKFEGLRQRMPGLVRSLFAEDPAQPGRYFARIMLRSKERQPARQKGQIIEQVGRISREAFPQTDSSPPAQVTGFFVLLANMISGMIRDQWITFSLATISIGLMMWVAFRSLVLAAIALIPNIMPILVIMGTLGWLDIKVNMGAAMIAAISMGLSIDSGIHYILAVQRHRARGRSTREALETVQQNVGQAVVFSTVSLVLGFASLCLSEFIPTVYFGALLSISMLGGLFGNVVVLPLLLNLVLGERGTE